MTILRVLRKWWVVSELSVRWVGGGFLIRQVEWGGGDLRLKA